MGTGKMAGRVSLCRAAPTFAARYRFGCFKPPSISGCMPFTFSHPALVIPLLYTRRKYQWVSATGLIVGSMAPDCEKFIRLKLASAHSHTVASIFYFSCPVTLAVAFLFHLLVRRPLISHLPGMLYRRLEKYVAFDWLTYFRRYYWGVLLSAIVGAALHLFWDSFTHSHTLTADLLPGLRGIVWVGGRTEPIFFVVSVVSSVMGGGAIALAVWLMPARPLKPVPRVANVLQYWGLAGLVALVLEIQWILIVQPRILSAGIAAITAGLVGVLAASVYFGRRMAARRF